MNKLFKKINEQQDINAIDNLIANDSSCLINSEQVIFGHDIEDIGNELSLVSALSNSMDNYFRDKE